VPSLLIKIRRARWYKPPPVFVPEGDIAADCLADLRISDNALSVWLIEESNSNLDRVLTALAANSDRVDNIDYLLFNDSVITKLGLKVRNAEGETPDESANRQWHRDLIELTGRRTLDFVIAIYNESTTGRVPKATVLERLTRAVANSELDTNRLKAGVAETLHVVKSPTP
jgi:hypothetical protein